MNAKVIINNVMFNKFTNKFIDSDYPTELMQFTGNVNMTVQCAIGDNTFVTGEVLISNAKGKTLLSSLPFYWNPESTCFEFNFTDNYTVIN